MVKNPPASEGDMRDTGSILGSGRSPGGRHSKPLQCSGLENSMDRGAYQPWCIGRKESDKTKVIKNHSHS